MNSLLSPSNHRGVAGWLVIFLAAILISLGAALFLGGAWLIGLGGSWYYLFAGAGLLASGIAMLVGSVVGVWIYVLTYVATWIWAVWEVGIQGWALVPRVVAPTVLLIPVLVSTPFFSRRMHSALDKPARQPEATEASEPRYGDARRAAASVAFALLCFGALAVYVGHGAAKVNSPTPQGSTPVIVAEPPAGSSPTARAPTEAQAAPSNPTPAANAAPTMQAGADWPAYGGTIEATRYSPLDQINRDNVGDLKRVWTFRTGDLPDKDAKGHYSPETTPLKVGDDVFLCSAKNIIISLDAATGKEWWRYDPKVSDDSIPYGATCRGVAFYSNPVAASDDLCAARIIEGTLDARLIAVDAKTGELCSDFGTDGTVDLTKGIGETVPGWYGNVAAPTIVRGIVIMGAQVQDGQAEDAPSGVIRGYDAVTGKLAWAWDMCNPSLTGEPPAGQTYTRGTPNMWTSAAADEVLGYVYIPLGNSSVDYYGGNRKPCENDFSSSLVAIDVTTGKPVWHFQTVHYDLWDYDLGSQPTLVDISTDKGSVPAVILTSKQGEIYALDRRTGKPLFPVDERKAPKGGVEEAALSPTQPFSGYATVAKPPLTEKDMWGMSPLDQLWCRIQFRRAYYEGEYTPPTHDRNFIEYPSYNGGSDWGSVAVDLKDGILVVNYNNMANLDRLLTRDEANKLGLKPINVPHKPPPSGPVEWGPQAGSPYAIQVRPGWRLRTGLMCTEPPYGGIRAIDLSTGKTLWDEPLGEARRNGPFGIPSMLPITIGTPNNGGALVTAGGLIFIAAATDDLIRAIDIKTGKVLWQDQLPAGGQATPMTFEADGRQYIGFMAGGHHFMHTPVGDYVLAYALPS
jgi:quinoprotein glucose dehydrogenase